MKRRKFLASAAILGAAATSAFGISRANAGNSYYSGPVSDHFDGDVFFNPGGTKPRGFADLLRWQFGGGRAAWPAEWPSPFAGATPEPIVGTGQLRVTHIGHATLLYQFDGLNVLVDPVWSERMSPVSFAGPKRVNPPGIVFDDLPAIDAVLVTHNHYDHLDMATLRRLHGRDAPLFITPLGNDRIIAKGVPGARTIALDWRGKTTIGNTTIHAEPCHHWSARGTSDRRHALWAAFVLETSAGPIIHVGDTGYDGGRPYRLLRERHGPPRFAALPIGAYAPRWFMSAQHQDPAEAVSGFEILGAAMAGGHHWGTVQLTNEAVSEPKERLVVELQGRGIDEKRFPALHPGQVLDIPVLSV